MQLLVSVRNAAEAIVAADNGADIIDVKEPEAGALGFAGVEVVREVYAAVGQAVRVSAAMGECTDWLNNAVDTKAVAAEVSNLQFLKVGLASMCAAPADSKDSEDVYSANKSAGWVQQWRSVRDGLSVDSSDSATASRQPGWVAVAYADHRAAGSPAPLEVLDAAIDTGCSAFLIDTFCKDGLGAFHWVTMDDLQRIRRRTSEHGLQFALAGQLNEQHLSEINTIRPDILAVRGAVCDDRDRRSTISGSRVRKLRDLLNEV